VDKQMDKLVHHVEELSETMKRLTLAFILFIELQLDIARDGKFDSDLLQNYNRSLRHLGKDIICKEVD